ncbi:hypothetical protein [Burkholderia cenocepacia]|uniref:hypothetical protein n=1 Tax=Burkholderia cenocepacia TaxID=95486 RepID=UPI002875C2C8|nr:hypothetical protein [Burkholderia cenocepacia]MDS0850423.1 hypothetical protein [Burkholderia cenocepacia]
MSWHHGDWLSFAQAAASIAAIIGAFGVVFLQHHLEGKRKRKADRDDARRVLRIAHAFTKRAWLVVCDVSSMRNNPERIENEPDRLKFRNDLWQVLEALNGLPINTLPTAVSAEQIIRARSELAAACFEASKRREVDGPGSRELGAPWLKWDARLVDAMKIISDEMEKLSDEK